MRITLRTAALVIALGVLATSISAQPVLLVSEDEFDFGYAPQGSTISHSFWLKSVGDEDLVVDKIIPGCGCTQAPLEKNVIPPGDSARLDIIFSTRKYRGFTSKPTRIQSNSTGVERRVTVMANLLDDPKATSPLTFAPLALDISPLSSRSRTSLPFTIQNVGSEPLALRIIEYPEDIIRVTLPDTLDPGQVTGAHIELTDAGENQEFEESMTIETDDPARSRFTLPIKRVLAKTTE
jgi:hypothetical protein